MSDSDETPKKVEAPSWQAKSSDESPQEKQQTSSEESESRGAIVEQAKRFLEQDEVRDESTDKKIAFLESKGLQGDEIQQLLGISRNREATSETIKPDSPPASPPPPPSPPPAPPSPIQTPYEQPTNYTPQRDSPPIITYPEFLTTPTHPSPLITKPRLLATLYIFSSLSFLLYGTSNYLVTPMLASLTSSRLSLLSSASENLTKLISRLEGLVSEIPTTGTGKIVGDGDKGVDSDSDSDPTELFHRDIGVQTSLPSTPSSPIISDTNTGLSTQTNNLKGLTASLRSLLQENANLAESTQDLESSIGVLREYCDELAYVQPVTTYGYNGGLGRAEEKDDEIAKVKASIRGVKGVLLSARSFPGGVRAGVR